MAYKTGWTQVLRPGLTIVGIDARTTNAAEMDPATGKIGPLWRRFMTTDPLAGVEGRTSPGTTHAVYTSYASDHRGEYTIVIGEAVVGAAAPPVNKRGPRVAAELAAQLLHRPQDAEALSFERRSDGLAQVTIRDAFYFPVVARGPMPAALMKAWGQIWAHFDQNATPKRAYTADYEIHKPGGEVDIYVAVATDDAANRTLQ